jgi:hypothetical protein
MDTRDLHEKCYSPTCYASRTTTPAAETSTDVAGGDVYRLEINFFYAFTLTPLGLKRALAHPNSEVREIIWFDWYAEPNLVCF